MENILDDWTHRHDESRKRTCPECFSRYTYHLKKTNTMRCRKCGCEFPKED